MTSQKKLRKRATLDKSRLMRLRQKEEQAQEVQIPMTPDTVQAIGDELVRATQEAFNEELAYSSENVRSMVDKFEDVIQEFFVGFKEGVDEEIKDFLRTQGESLKDATEDVGSRTSEVLKKISEHRENERRVSQEVLSRPRDLIDPQMNMGQQAGDFLLSVVGGVLGLDRLTQRKIDEWKRRESFVQTEMGVRGLEDTRQNRKELKAQYQEIETSTQELSALEKEVAALKASGYDDKQIEVLLGYAEKRSELLARLKEVDVSRREMYGDAGEGVDLSDTRREEEKHEELLIARKEFEEVEGQTVILEDVRDIMSQMLKELEKDEQVSSSGIGLSGGLMGGLGGGRTTAGKTPAKGGTGALGRAGATVAGGMSLAKGLAIPALLAYGATNLADWGLGKALHIGKDENGEDKFVDEEQDDANWERMSTWQKIESGLARSVENIGSFIGLGNVATEAEVARIEKETQYLDQQEMEASGIPKEDVKVDGAPIVTKPEPTTDASVETVKQSVGLSKPVVATDSYDPDKAERIGGELGRVGNAIYHLEEQVRDMDDGPQKTQLLQNIRQLNEKKVQLIQEYSSMMVGQSVTLEKINNQLYTANQTLEFAVEQSLKKTDVPEMEVGQAITQIPVESEYEAPIRDMPGNLMTTVPDQTMVETIKEVGRNITVNVPPPTVVNAGGGKTEVIPQPFTDFIKNNEPSVSRYLSSRY